MEINSDFSRRASVHAASMEWTPSPIAGVDRRMLDRIGDEVAQATTIVRYAPNSRFSPHVHSGGEEFLVLSGVFQDEHGDFPTGSYIRNPRGTKHTPGSEPGCVIFVKLWQFDSDDKEQLRRDTTKVPFVEAVGRPGVEIKRLFHNQWEDVRIERWKANARITTPVAAAGLEVLVLDGSFKEGGETFVGQSWLRLPKGAKLDANAGPDGCLVWIKVGRSVEPAHPQIGEQH
jgi:anti-sigma factor ChrR (cupin superfamily)